MRYVEAYTSFLDYCSNKLEKTIKELVFEFKNNGIEKDFLLLYKEKNCLSSREYFNLLKENDNGAKRFTKAKKDN